VFQGKPRSSPDRDSGEESQSPDGGNSYVSIVESFQKMALMPLIGLRYDIDNNIDVPG
jgi:hypothetical protein